MSDRVEEETLLYSGLEVNASKGTECKCTECGKCEEKCPQETPKGDVKKRCRHFQ